MEYKIFNVLPEFGTNTYLVWDETTKEALLIDPASPSQAIVDEIREKKLNLKYLINTHGHGDHIGGNKLIKSQFDVPLIIHQADAEMLTNSAKNLSTYWNNNVISTPADVQISGEYHLDLGSQDVVLIPTPGHSPGGISILVGDLLFSGDTLFCESVGRSDLPGGNQDVLLKSIKEKLLILPDHVKVLPGHGPSTTIEDEKVGNPFVGLVARL